MQRTAAAESHCCETLQERERDSVEELEAAKQQAQAATHAFNAVRQARYDTFMQAFNHISAGIDKIFKVSQMARPCKTNDCRSCFSVLQCALCRWLIPASWLQIWLQFQRLFT